jgi:hypothetical protein
MAKCNGGQFCQLFGSRVFCVFKFPGLWSPQQLYHRKVCSLTPLNTVAIIDVSTTLSASPSPPKKLGNFLPRLANRSEFLFRQKNTKFDLPSLQHRDAIQRFNCCVVADHSLRRGRSITAPGQGGSWATPRVMGKKIPRDPEPRISVLAMTSSNLPDQQNAQ